MSKRNKKRLTRRQQEIRRKRLKKRRRRRRLVIILELIILCILGTTAFGLFKLGKMERTNLSKYKEQRTETDRIYQCCIIWSGFKRKESWKRKPDRYDYDRKHQ